MKFKRISALLLAFLIVLFCGFLLFRGIILEKAVQQIIHKTDQRYGARLLIGESEFEGLTRVVLNEIYLVPPSGDTIFYCAHTVTDLSLWRFLKGLPPVNNFIARNGYIRLHEYNDSTNNYALFLRKKSPTKSGQPGLNQPVNFTRTARRIWNNFFALSDFNLNITGFRVSWNAPGYQESMDIATISLDHTRIRAEALDSAGSHSVSWHLEGVVDPEREELHLNGGNGSGISQELPFLKRLTGTGCFVNTFSLSVTGSGISRNALRMSLLASATQPGILHWRVSPERVELDSLRTRLEIFIHEREIGTDTGSVVYINRIPLYANGLWHKKDSTSLTANIQIPKMEAQTFFDALPKGLFRTLEGIRVKGKLDYSLRFHVNVGHPDSLQFESELKKHDFRILAYGNENFAAINQPFTHQVRENDVVVRVIDVDPANPVFTPLDRISPLLINSVLTAEDGTFRFHKGFNEEAFRQSIATNIREKRFARGGSTITMQLVKNVFLHRNKTISRKVEEALIVWLIENNYLVSKDRMLEVYLNIIEWGPGVYGIGEAASFYFSKHPSQLSLEESIYLSSIIPRPKTFKYTFDKEGKMKEYLKSYFDIVAGRLLRKEIITQSVYDSLQFHVELRGPALELVLPSDSLPVDSLLKEADDELF